MSLAGLGLRNLLSLLVGSYLMVWFCVAGLVGLLSLRARLSLPSRRAVLGGLLAFAALWLGAGLFGQFVWLHWLLIPWRLLLWPLGALLLLPWFLAVGEATRGTTIAGWFGWWLAHTVVLAAGLWLAIRLDSALGFIGLILADAAGRSGTLVAGDRVVPQDMALCIERRAVYELAVPGRLSVAVNGRF